MQDYSNYTMNDFIQSYNFANNSIAFVGVESAIIALIVGGAKSDVGWGIGAFIVIMLLYGFPIFAGVFSLAFSLVEAILVYAILMNFSTDILAWVISLFAFCMFVNLHRSFGNVDNISLGYSLIIFDALVISGSIYIVYKTTFISIIIFVVLLIAAFIPILRVIESVTLAIGSAVVIGLLAAESLTTVYTLLIGLFVLLYTGNSYMYAYLGVNYKGYVQAKKNQKHIQERNDEIQALKKRMYNIYPQLEKYYYYFYTEVCQTDWDKIRFDVDWCSYLDFLESSTEKISFNQYFDREKLYRTSHYNRDFAKQNADEDFFGHQDQDKDISNDEMKILYFMGINNLEDLKKRYHDLLKIYHPDNQNGDVNASQIIQKEYEFLLNKLK